MPTIESDSQANDLTVLSELKDAHFDAHWLLNSIQYLVTELDMSSKYVFQNSFHPYFSATSILPPAQTQH